MKIAPERASICSASPTPTYDALPSPTHGALPKVCDPSLQRPEVG